MITIAMIQELDRLFLTAKTKDTVASWSAYFDAKARVDRIANTVAS